MRCCTFDKPLRLEETIGRGAHRRSRPVGRVPRYVVWWRTREQPSCVFECQRAIALTPPCWAISPAIVLSFSRLALPKRSIFPRDEYM